MLNKTNEQQANNIVGNMAFLINLQRLTVSNLFFN